MGHTLLFQHRQRGGDGPQHAFQQLGFAPRAAADASDGPGGAGR